MSGIDHLITPPTTFPVSKDPMSYGDVVDAVVRITGLDVSDGDVEKRLSHLILWQEGRLMAMKRQLSDLVDELERTLSEIRRAADQTIEQKKKADREANERASGGASGGLWFSSLEELMKFVGKVQ